MKIIWYWLICGVWLNIPASDAGLNRRLRGRCRPGQCDSNAMCQFVNSRSQKCRCKKGWQGNGRICYDINECAYMNGGCVHFCHNTPGSFVCRCQVGFREPLGDSKDCVDVDECQINNGGCQHSCVNLIGSYKCQCDPGYFLEADGKSCIEEQVCLKSECKLQCNNSSQGVHPCSCPPGFVEHPKTKTCKKTCKAGNGGCQHRCRDTPKGPICSCHENYQSIPTTVNCRATCAVKNGGCDKKCIDGPTGLYCECPSGYILGEDEKTCLDVNECGDKNGGCSDECKNVIGSFECICPDGYKLSADQVTCVDIDECQVPGTCEHICKNTPGSYYCECQPGYQLYGRIHCADIDECEESNGGCSHICVNTDGGHNCRCQNGWRLHSNGKDCIDATRCVSFTTPAKANVVCSQSYQGYYEETCQIDCEDKTRFLSISLPKFNITCGARTRYQWTSASNHDSPEMDSILGCSSLVMNGGYKRSAKVKFLGRSCKAKALVTDSLTTMFKTFQDGLGLKYHKRDCFINIIKVSCQHLTPKEKTKKHQYVSYQVIFEFGVSSRENSSKCNVECVQQRLLKLLFRLSRLIRKAVNKRLLLPGKSSEYPLKIVKKSYKVKKGVKKVCPEGYSVSGDICVGCSIGSFFDLNSGRCSVCPEGTYQDKEGQTFCLPCPDSMLVMQDNTSTMDHVYKSCSVVCPPGTYSIDGKSPCQYCPPGEYQGESGRTRCIACGHNITTILKGSISHQQCVLPEKCSPGMFWDTSQSKCEPCSLGSYQSERGRTFCYKCPQNSTTDSLGSKVIEDCKRQKCEGSLGSAIGYIQTPNYPGDYPNNAECIWQVNPGKGRRILLVIPELFLASDECGDQLVMRKSKRLVSLLTFESCKSLTTPIALTARSRKLWVQFKSNEKNTAKGFRIPYVTFNEEYSTLIEDIVQDTRLYSSKNHLQVLQDKKLLFTLMEVIADPMKYYDYIEVQKEMFPSSFIRLITPKVRKFFSRR